MLKIYQVSIALGVLFISLIAVLNFERGDSSVSPMEAEAQSVSPRSTLSPAEQLMRLKAQQRAKKEYERLGWKAQSDAGAAKVRLRLPSVSLGEVRRIATWTTPRGVARMEFSPNGNLVALFGKSRLDEGVGLYGAATGKEQGFFLGTSNFAWSPNSQLLAIENEGVNIWSVKSKRLVSNLSDGSGFFPTHSGKKPGVFGPVLFSEDGQRIATLGEDPHSKWKLDDGPQTEAAFARGQALKTWDVRSGKRLEVELGPSSGNVRGLVPLSRRNTHFAFWTGNALAVSKSRPRVYVYSSHVLQEKIFEPEHCPDEDFIEIPLSSEPQSIAVAANGWLYAYPSATAQAINIYRRQDEVLLRALTLPNNIGAFALSPDSRFLVVAFPLPRTKTFADGSTMLLYTSKIEVYDLGTRKQP